MRVWLIPLLLGLLGPFRLICQEDATVTRIPRVIFSADDNPELNNARMISDQDTMSQPELRLGGYISTYFAHYDDETENNNFVQFPTLAPRNDQFSLNMALISMQYRSKQIRSKITLHYGDIPESSWPKMFNLIQEAYAGLKLHKKLWIDAGFFKTHIGLGSFQPRENITSSMSIPDFYDPYFLSGAKLTYYPTSKLSLQLCAFNGYNEYVDNNKNKAFDFSANYSLNDHISLTYNFLTCDETPDYIKTRHQRFYHNFYATFIYDKFSIGLDVNFGQQQNTLKRDTSRFATMYAGTLTGKYNFAKKMNAYARGEDFHDPNEILTGKLDIGNYIHGLTVGVQYTPQKTAALNIEYRILESDKLIFRQGNTMLNQRNEFIVCLDLWF
jgi:hypothetical protein